MKLFNKLFKNSNSSNSKLSNRELNAIDELNELSISTQLKKNIDFIRNLLGKSNDVIIHSFISAYKDIPASFVYIEGLVDKTMINEQILGSLINDFRMFNNFEQKKGKIEDIFRYQLISMSGIKLSTKWKEIILDILSGETVLFVDGIENALIISSRAWEQRSINEPVSEATVRGPHEGFVETLRTNTTLIRRKIRDPYLRFEQMKIGLRSQTEVNIVYIEGLTNSELLKEVKKRLKDIEIDRIMNSSEIEQLIEDNTYSIFPQITGTERPDKVVTGLLDGQVAVMSDNSPYILLMPVTLERFLISSDDYYERWFFSSLIRIIRYIAVVIVLSAPGLYVSLAAINPELMPTPLLVSTAAARTGVPFPVIVELLMMEFTLELLREAGVRLPRPIGQTISIVGALVLGESAIAAGVVSPLTVIIVALTAIASFVVPNYSFSNAIRLARFPITIMSGIFGVYGWVMSLLFLVVHLVNLKSFNVPYLAPYTPLSSSDLKDSIIIAPLKLRGMRPDFFAPKQSVRSQQSYTLKFKSEKKLKNGVNKHENNKLKR